MRLLIIGAGYVGAACARHFRQLGFPVCCRTRTAASAAALAAEGFVTQHGDIAAARDLGFTPTPFFTALPPAVEGLRSTGTFTSTAWPVLGN